MKKLYLLLIFFLNISISSQENLKIVETQSFGDEVGSFNGVSAYSNGTVTNNSGVYNTSAGINTGLKWQCVEFVNRYYYKLFNVDLKSSPIYGNANHYYSNGTSAGLIQLPNGNTSPPQVGDIICSNGGDYGHIAIVREVNTDNVKVIQQNWSNTSSDNNKSLTLAHTGNIYTIGSFNTSYPIVGWLRIVNPVLPTCTFNVTVKGTNPQSLINGWKFWRDSKSPSRMDADFYTVSGTITNLPIGSNWSMYLVDPSNNRSWQIRSNQSSTTFTFSFSPPIDASNSEGYSFRLTPQGQPSTVWAQSNNFSCSSLPSLNISVSPIPLVIGQEATVAWSISGGITTIADEGWIGNIRLQWYQNGEEKANALSNISSPPVVDHEYVFLVPTSISNTIIPGNNFKIAGVADTGTSLPPELVYAFTSFFDIISNPTEVDNKINNIPQEFSLEQNYPNPFNPSTNISFSLSSKSFVSLKVFDLTGREVATLVSEELSAGNYTKQWNAEVMPSGVYFYRITTGSFMDIKKLVLIK